MKHILIILTIACAGCKSTATLTDGSNWKSGLNYSDYESSGGFNYAEDVWFLFDKEDSLILDETTRILNLDTSLQPCNYLKLETKKGDL